MFKSYPVTVPDWTSTRKNIQQGVKKGGSFQPNLSILQLQWERHEESPGSKCWLVKQVSKREEEWTERHETKTNIFHLV
jgi:hypothetical protein